MNHVLLASAARKICNLSEIRIFAFSFRGRTGDLRHFVGGLLVFGVDSMKTEISSGTNNSLRSVVCGSHCLCPYDPNTQFTLFILGTYCGPLFNTFGINNVTGPC